MTRSQQNSSSSTDSSDSTWSNKTKTPHSTPKKKGNTPKRPNAPSTSKQPKERTPQRRRRGKVAFFRSNFSNGKLSWKSFKEMEHLRMSTYLLIPKHPFARLVREISQERGDFRYQSAALLALQEASEHHLVFVLSHSNRLSSHAKRSTLMVDDIRMYFENSLTDF